MKIDKKELIDFYDWWMQNSHQFSFNDESEDIVDAYLKSFNSQASEETPSVNDNKDKEKVCPRCGGKDTIWTLWCNDCAKCM